MKIEKYSPILFFTEFDPSEEFKIRLEKMTAKCYNLISENIRLKQENSCLKNRLHLIYSMTNPETSLSQLDTENMDYPYDMPEEIGIDHESCENSENSENDDENLIEPMVAQYQGRRRPRQSTRMSQKSYSVKQNESPYIKTIAIPDFLHEHSYSKLTYNPSDHIPVFTVDPRYPEISESFLLECHEEAEKSIKMKRSKVENYIYQDRVFARLIFHRLFSQRELKGRSATGRVTRYNNEEPTLEINPDKKTYIREKLMERVQAIDPERLHERCSYSRLIRWFSMFVHSRNNGYKRTKTFVEMTRRAKKKVKNAKKTKRSYSPEVVYQEYYNDDDDSDDDDQSFVKLEI